MSSRVRILVAFLLNLGFSIFEFIGGAFTNSISIMSDALHDAGDAISILVSYILEVKSIKGKNNYYTYGYRRYSVLGALITTVILIIGAFFVIISSSIRIINPSTVNYNGMIILAVIGVVVNLVATYVTHKGSKLNQKAVSLHMFEDVLGWVVVLVGAFVIKFTGFYIIDAIMSICVSLFILFSALKNLKEVLDLFMEKSPIDIKVIEKDILSIDGVKGVHHLHIWSIDEENVSVTLHVVSKLKDFKVVKSRVKEVLKKKGITHVTVEMEEESEKCESTGCE